ncbi:MAG: alpha/beta hydrolase [Gammaproteobacteria bacterium]|nr:alpha/beta hydrolase [Gammaproteobacteria bacterium]
MREVVVLIHGLWKTGNDSWRLRQRLQKAGYECQKFSYQSLRHSPEENARRLHQFVSAIDAPVIHFVCHSLGGIVLLKYFDMHPSLIRGRVVLLGSPVNGSQVARRLSKHWYSRWLIGKSATDDLLGSHPVWNSWREIGIIAGTLPLGVGLLSGWLPLPHDGTVTVSETVLHGATDFITLPVTHTSLLYSSKVAQQTITFLRAGKFGDEIGNMLLESEPT